MGEVGGSFAAEYDETGHRAQGAVTGLAVLQVVQVLQVLQVSHNEAFDHSVNPKRVDA